MKKVILAKEMARVEKLAYQDGSLEEQFMRNAAAKIAEEVQKTVAELHIKPNIGFLIGKGNNGGDGLLAAKILALGGFTITAYCFAKEEESSPLNQQMRKELKQVVSLTEVSSLADFDLRNEELLIDGLFGTGFQGTLSPLLQNVLARINEKALPVVSIDIPSGINGDEGKKNEAIIAYKTLFLGAAKWGCFIENAFDHLGSYAILDFGLSDKYLDQAEVLANLFSLEDAKKILPPIERSRHKYQAGYVLGVGGSQSMTGAALLASIATLRVGAGIIRLFHPKNVQMHPPLEVIKEEFSLERFIEEQKRAKAIFIGPGMGRDNQSLDQLKRILAALEKPTVFDADALFHIAKNKLSFPPFSILTPHKGEMDALLGEKLPFAEFLSATEQFSNEKKCILVLKGPFTRVFIPNTPHVIITEGDPGMATAGSGDVLTGVITGFLAQNLDPVQAALLGVFTHGLSGSLGAKDLSSYSLIASDLLTYLPQALIKIQTQ